jgi:hypothetical protein
MAFLLVLLGLGLIAAVGAPWLVPVIVVAALAFWFLRVLFGRGAPSPERAVRETPKAEPLGPGGPNDPEAASP